MAADEEGLVDCEKHISSGSNYTTATFNALDGSMGAGASFWPAGMPSAVAVFPGPSAATLALHQQRQGQRPPGLDENGRATHSEISPALA